MTIAKHYVNILRRHGFNHVEYKEFRRSPHEVLLYVDRWGKLSHYRTIYKAAEILAFATLESGKIPIIITRS